METRNNFKQGRFFILLLIQARTSLHSELMLHHCNLALLEPLVGLVMNQIYATRQLEYSL